jgi:anti-sigma B factor antagonist
MKFERIDNGDETQIKIGGTLDALTAPELRPLISDIVDEKRKHIVVELSDLELIDSSGVAVIVSLYKRVRATGGDVKVIGVRDQPLSIFKLLRMDRVFSI